MPVYVVGVGSVLVMRVIRMMECLVMVGFVVVMRQRHPSIVVMVDVRIISSTMAMEDRAHDTNANYSFRRQPQNASLRFSGRGANFAGCR
jgi:hypothetical protein